MMLEGLLEERQRFVADRVLDEEDSRRRHVVVALSGAHAYGFPSPDSDLDLKAIHVAPTSRLVGLHPEPGNAERMEVIAHDGANVEIDYSSNELGAALASVVKGNGNYLERILGACTMRTSPEHEALIPLVRATISKRLHRHYLGFAGSQRREVEASAAPTAKRVLYVLRTALTGVHALRTGEIVPDLREHLARYGFEEASALIEQKRAGEQVVLTDLDRWRAVLDRAFVALAAAVEESPLPDEPGGVDALETFVIELRRAWF